MKFKSFHATNSLSLTFIVKRPGPVVTNSNAFTTPPTGIVCPGSIIVELLASLTRGTGYSGIISPLLTNMVSGKKVKVQRGFVTILNKTKQRLHTHQKRHSFKKLLKFHLVTTTLINNQTFSLLQLAASPRITSIDIELVTGLLKLATDLLQLARLGCVGEPFDKLRTALFRAGLEQYFRLSQNKLAS